MEKDKFKFPNRTCKKCKKYPCFDGIDLCKSDFAKYGCEKFKHDVKDR